MVFYLKWCIQTNKSNLLLGIIIKRFKHKATSVVACCWVSGGVDLVKELGEEISDQGLVGNHANHAIHSSHALLGEGGVSLHGETRNTGRDGVVIVGLTFVSTLAVCRSLTNWFAESRECEGRMEQWRVSI